MAILLYNIKELFGIHPANEILRGSALANLPSIKNAYVIVEGEQIAAFGRMDELKHKPNDFNESLDATGRLMLPSWCDSHTHLVFAGSREGEFVDKIKGLSYADIAAKGGGILASAKKLAEASEDDLFVQSYKRLQEIISLGTGAVEIKSGYGLSVESELKMLRVIKRLKGAAKIPIKSTFLGAHAFPTEYKEAKEDYIKLIIEKMLPQIAAEGLADYVDAFCEEGFFTTEQTERICLAGKAYGLKPKLHVNQLNSIGGIQTGVKVDAVSLDHLETMTDDDIEILSKAKNTVGTLLPSAAFFLRMNYQPARKMIDAGCAVALASDFNPGSSPSGNMNFVVALSCIQLRMLPEEAVNAATLNGAAAMELQHEAGSIATAKKANLLLTKPVPGLAYLPYSFGNNLLERIMLCGDWK
ncbi:imidazolonepropionase [Flavisolibacter ginsenosidimutans]|uniref:Imidazolonepropionase n=1 Tax=Flavisolibacter ginsenosidimutans TaxID=661481 RepID=A0A5B8UF33_9BACT|nr:imidazolonepropionase [Flavisolibacter ginsenosidimutans]QEC55083.1 imidazolonepropionase [Flavisolibacter ginsenosidimutans]